MNTTYTFTRALQQSALSCLQLCYLVCFYLNVTFVFYLVNKICQYFGYLFSMPQDTNSFEWPLDKMAN